MKHLPVVGSQESIQVSKVICLAQNYKRHAKEMGSTPPELPYFFFKPSTALIGAGENIVIPKMSNLVHHEIELAVVIGKGGKDIPESKALEHVFGYAIFLDITARDLQKKAKERRTAFDIAKSFDTFAPISKITSASKVPNPNALDLKLWVNGELRQDSNTSDLIFPVERLISFLSEVMTLELGDIIATGTPEGVATIKAGDRLKAEISGLGVLANQAVQKI
jgi:2-keto-4-pentenoate hydratase/2-oxohepta-3-ene-1,7-dioic acid hydratase in catechol pathway